jgi:hypothetical protein
MNIASVSLTHIAMTLAEMTLAEKMGGSAAATGLP